MSSNSIACPFCGAETRHASRGDRRGAMAILNHGYYCFECGEKGPLSALPKSVKFDYIIREPGKPKPYPPEHEVLAVWSHCSNVNSDGIEYLKQRTGMEELRLNAKLFGSLPDNFYETGWLKGWRKSQRTLIFPLYDSAFTVKSVLARSLGNAKVKSLSPAGYTRKGLFLWNGVPPGPVVIIAEGEIDVVSWDQAHPDKCVFGYFSGSYGDWVEQLKWCDVVLALDHDDAGNAYCDEIMGGLDRTCRVIRWTPQTS